MLVVVTTTIVAELLLLTLAMLMEMMIVVIVSSVQSVAPALIGKTLQFAFIVHALQQLTFL
jgi:hypothetical protein